MTKPAIRGAFLLALGAFGSVALAQDEVYLKVTSPGLQRVVFAPPQYARTTGAEPTGSSAFSSTLQADIERTSVISILPADKVVLVEIAPSNPTLTRQRWRAVGAQFLLEVTIGGSAAQLTVDARLWDLSAGETAYSRRLQAPPALAPTVAHTLANELLRLFTGKPGPFLSRIAFISDRSGHKELWVMRWDGGEPQQLTTYRSITLGPAWSADGQWLAFTSFMRGNPELFILRPTQGYLKPISSLPGVNSSPSFSPDGKQIAFASGEGGRTNIFIVPAEGGTPARVSVARAIETQPAWSPNGRQIAFTSAVSGAPQLYLMDAEGTNVRRLTFQDKFADEAAWAPDGIRLAYTTMIEGTFQIAILDLRTNERTVVAGPGSNESPCWSPDGTMLAFVSDRTGKKQILLTDPDGKPRQITSDGNNTDPAWVAQVQ